MCAGPCVKRNRLGEELHEHSLREPGELAETTVIPSPSHEVVVGHPTSLGSEQKRGNDNGISAAILQKQVSDDTQLVSAAVFQVRISSISSISAGHLGGPGILPPSIFASHLSHPSVSPPGGDPTK